MSIAGEIAEEQVSKTLKAVLDKYANNHDERSAGLAFPSAEDLIYENGHRAGYAYAVECITRDLYKSFGIT